MFDLSGKTILVTGASKGIGASIVDVLGRQGANVIAHYGSDRAGAEAATASIPKDRLSLVAADLSKPGAAARLWRDALAWKGRIDVLVNNAGISHRSGFAATGLAVIRRVMEVNFFGAVHCTKAALPHLLRSRGLVIAISSVAGYTPLVARTGYAASKHALHGFFDSLRTELAPQGVEVMIVCPSFVATRIDVNALGGDGGPVQHAQVTVGRPLAATDVAAAILDGAARGRRLLLVGRTARQAWWMSRLAPRLYERIMSARLRGELEGP